MLLAVRLSIAVCLLKLIPNGTPERLLINQRILARPSSDGRRDGPQLVRGCEDDDGTVLLHRMNGQVWKGHGKIIKFNLCKKIIIVPIRLINLLDVRILKNNVRCVFIQWWRVASVSG